MAQLFFFFFGLNQHANIGSVSPSFCLGGTSSWVVLVSHSGLQLTLDCIIFYSVINVFCHQARHCLSLSFDFQIHTETHTQNREFSRQNQSVIFTFPRWEVANSVEVKGGTNSHSWGHFHLELLDKWSRLKLKQDLEPALLLDVELQMQRSRFHHSADKTVWAGESVRKCPENSLTSLRLRWSFMFSTKSQERLIRTQNSKLKYLSRNDRRWHQGSWFLEWTQTQSHVGAQIIDQVIIGRASAKGGGSLRAKQ